MFDLTHAVSSPAVGVCLLQKVKYKPLKDCISGLLFISYLNT